MIKQLILTRNIKKNHDPPQINCRSQKSGGAPLPAVVFVGGSWYVFGSKMLTPEQLDGSLKLWLSNKCLMEIQWPWLWSTLPKKPRLLRKYRRPPQKRRFRLETTIFGGYVSFEECSAFIKKKPSVQFFGENDDQLLTNIFWNGLKSATGINWGNCSNYSQAILDTIRRSSWGTV